ncbi:PTS fructose transporter subunit IIB [Secundilactobacillus paracollinoides]|uniref:PTS fructose transporter subunit IIB n=1 Tax=Secundilactobacillus paracollinoides TaxID=240427 RepID=A0A1B2IZD8_9LACO|nr:PTS sugar transporter subunit IIB [Secundilactobacillus paracollinoides]ANZ61515.1 PTS fructose transporter subunit IIB [Secundilactobacillus paracollinoides]ANZ64096.1 PTS fructose transporter subunit IIB [Secundilactobacillus paracollinoides]ANZ67436.1 PTS fructose transporter subunit IIB [Secundilactobacillus paracollinoides]
MSMDIRLARVDSRLLHGQVATVWTSSVKPNRILVVSDSVAQDKLRKTLITQAAPAGVKANVITIAKMIAIFKDPRFDVFKTLLLTETVQDMVALVKGGVDFSQVGINIGSLSYQDGMTMLTDAIAVDHSAVDAIRYLHDDAHLDVYAQKVPADRKQDLMALLTKKGL